VHELSIMDGALALACSEAEKAGARRVVSLRLRIGMLSGVMPEALRFAFDALAAGSIAEGAEIPTDHPIVTTLAKDFTEVTGEQPVFSGRMGAADTRFLIRHGETPTVIFGPGVTAQMHATNEWLPLENLTIATKTLALAIHDWCQ